MSTLTMTKESSTPSTPASGKFVVYQKSDGLYLLNDTGLEIGPLAPANGWQPDSNTWTYSSADSPTFVISINADMTTKLKAGMRIKLTQTTAKYFIVTAVGAFAAGATLVTVYGGTDYTLANATITSPYYSSSKSPFGFPMDPAKWIVSLSDTTNASQASPTSGTYYNLGSLSITIPIGAWNVFYEVESDTVVTTTAARAITLSCALSTSTSSVSDTELRATQIQTVPILTGAGVRFVSTRRKFLNLAAKTTYYLIQFVSSFDAPTSVAFRGDLANTVVKAVCAYL